MPKGVSESYRGQRRSEAARKGAASRARRKAAQAAIAAGVPAMTPAEIEQRRGSQADRVMTGAAISALIARIRATHERG